ncbi:MAG: hypothetical protein HYV28_21175 [Ignavibacteriales bacterium]|nr:hypothetical protein [Ignavibacteriales bacterium]
MKYFQLLLPVVIAASIAYFWEPPVLQAIFTEESGTHGTFWRIPVELPDSLTRRFTKDAFSTAVKIVDSGNLIVFGYPTHNKEIYESIILPYMQKNYGRLKQLPYKEIINECTLLSFTLYTSLVGKSFYRWGGDIGDIDDPQPEGVRYKKRYGLDCSGFATSGYEIANRAGLIPDTAKEALFCRAGLINYTKSHPFRLRGAVLGGNNNYRLDTSELAELGTVVFSLPKGGQPNDAQIAKLQAGDIVGLDGHVGIIAFVAGKPYYLESGGYVLPEHNFEPVPAQVALAEFASFCEISVRRAQ